MFDCANEASEKKMHREQGEQVFHLVLIKENQYTTNNSN